MMQQNYKILRIDPRFWLYFVAIGIFYLLGANTGSGWIFILSATFFTICLLSAVLPLFALIELSADIIPPPNIPAGTPACLKVHLGSPQKQGSEITGSPPVPLLVFLLLGKTSTTKINTGNANQNQRLAGWAPSSPDSEVVCPPIQRGIYDGFRCQLQTSSPLGLIWWQKQISIPAQLIVYPQILPMHGIFLFKLAALVPLSSSRSAKRSAVLTTHIKDIRPYRRGDSPRDIHWSLSARHGKLLIKEYEKEGLPFFDLLLAPATAFDSSEQLELALMAAASILSFGHEHGLEPTLSILARSSPGNKNQPGQQLQKTLYADREQQLSALAGMQLQDREPPHPSLLPSSTIPVEETGQEGRALIWVFPENQPLPETGNASPSITLRIAASKNRDQALPAAPTGMLNYLLSSAEELLNL